jgi:hypothetical protein
VSTSDNSDPPDPPLTEHETAIASALPSALVEKIDAALLSHAKPRGRVVAMLVGM